MLVSSIIFISCSGNKEDETVTDTSLIGTWKFIEYSDVEGIETADDCDSNDKMIFKSDGTFNYTYHSKDNNQMLCEQTQNAEGQWEKVTENKINLVYSEIDTRDVEYSTIGDILSLTFDETAAGGSIYTDKYKKVN